MNMHAHQDTFGHPDLRAIFRDQFTALALLRQSIEQTLAVMVDALDRLDMQTEDLEPSLASPELCPGYEDQTYWAAGSTADVEADCHETAEGAL